MSMEPTCFICIIKVNKNVRYLIPTLLAVSNIFNLADEQDWRDSTLHASPWKGAEAYYFMRKTHDFYHSKEYHDAMCLAYRLQNYIKFLPAYDVYSLLAITSFKRTLWYMFQGIY